MVLSMTDLEFSRRQFISAVSSGVVLSLAGCSTNSKGLDIPPKNFEMDIPDDVLVGLDLYEKVRQRERPDIPEGKMVVTVGSNLYEDVGVKQELAEMFQFEQDVPYRVIGPTYIDIAAGSVISGAIENFRNQVNRRIDKRVDSMIRERLKQFEGVTDVETTIDETLHKEYEVEVELPSVDISKYSPLIEEETIVNLDPIIYKGGYEIFEVSDSIDYFGVVWIEPEDTYSITLPGKDFPEAVQSQLDGDKTIELDLDDYEHASLEALREWVKTSAADGEEQV